VSFETRCRLKAGMTGAHWPEVPCPLDVIPALDAGIHFPWQHGMTLVGMRETAEATAGAAPDYRAEPGNGLPGHAR